MFSSQESRGGTQSLSYRSISHLTQTMNAPQKYSDSRILGCLDINFLGEPQRSHPKSINTFQLDQETVTDLISHLGLWLQLLLAETGPYQNF